MDPLLLANSEIAVKSEPCRQLPTYLASPSAGARVHVAMGIALGVKINPQENLCQRNVLKTNPKGLKTECVFADGTAILLSNFLASFIRAGDDLLFSLDFGAADSSTEIYIRNTNPGANCRDIFQTRISYASQPRQDKRKNLFVSAEVSHSRLGVTTIHLPSETLRDYFYVGDRHRAWDLQASFYELLKVDRHASPTELRLAFKLRTLELRTAQTPHSHCAALERAFNILARPELRACYDALLGDPASPTLFPYGGFGSLLVTGHRSRDGSTFYASRILSFLPEKKFQHFQAPLRKVAFYNDHAIFRDSRRKVEILFDQTLLPLLWDSGWNQWKHLLGVKIGVKATFIQNGRYFHCGGAWQLAQWETALPSRIEVGLPLNIAEQIAEARKTHTRLGQFSEALDLIRARIESAPVERAELQKLCTALGMPGDFDVSLINWRPDYDAFYYKQLCRRSRYLYLFRNEYIFDLERTVVVEIPQLGHATYLFSKPTRMPEFLAIYCGVTREEILQNRGNLAEKLGFLGRLIHGLNPQAWCKELKMRVGENVAYAEASD